jgi:uncharacterized membrane protein HdeD (DUF308 family)
MATESLRTALAEDLKLVYRRTWWALVIRGLLAVMLGLVIVTRPLDSVAALSLVIAIWALVVGMTEIMHAFDLRHAFGSWWMLLLAGLVSVAFGVAALYNYPGLSLGFIVLWVAWWFLVTGTLGIVAALRLRKLSIDWGWTFAWGLFSAATGVVALAYPLATLAAVMSLIAAFAIIGGSALLVGAFRLRSAAQRVARAV